MKYFTSCTTISDVKTLYKDLAKKHHPDCGGDTAIMQEINTEYAFASAKVLKGENLSEEEIENELMNIEAYRVAINAIIYLEGIQIEILGTWLWVSGDTKPHCSIKSGGSGILPDAGFVFGWEKKAWYFRTEEFKTKNRKKMSLEEIRNKYGSTVVNSKSATRYLGKKS
jgi:hypothetical protein